MPVRQPEGLGGRAAQRPAEAFDQTGRLVFQRIAFAPVFAAQVENQADEEQHEGEEHELGDIERTHDM